MRIPQQYRLWRQTNSSDFASVIPAGGNLGELWMSNGIDLTESAGVVRLGKRVLININSTDVSQLTGVPVGFRSVASGNIYTAAGASGTGYVFVSSLNTPSATFAKNNIVGGATPPSTIDSLYSDIDSLNGQLFVTTVNLVVYYLNAAETAWSTQSIAGGGTDNYPHLLATFANRMYMTYNGNKIISWDNAATPNVAGIGAQYTITLGIDGATEEISWIRAASNRMWIGTIHKRGGKGRVFSWDGSSAQTTAEYRMDSPGSVACVIKDDVPHVIDVFGSLLKWNGGTFLRLARFNKDNKRFFFGAFNVGNNRFVHPNGMSIIDGHINVLIDGRNYDGSYANPDTFTEQQTIPSGIWEYDPDLGFYHKHPLGIAHAGDTIADYGQLHVNSTSTTGGVGALSEMVIGSSGANDGSFLCGYGYSDDISSSGGSKWAIGYDNTLDTKQKAGSFVTGKIQSSRITDTWQKFSAVYSQLLNSSDFISVKYRTSDTNFVEVTDAKPTGTTTFTTGGAVSSFAIGDEVEFIQGKNSGICAHITAISFNSGTGLYTVTLDQTITNSGPATSRARFQKWIKLFEVSDQVSSYKQKSLGSKASPWIQFKVWMKWTGKNQIEVLNLTSTPLVSQ